MCVYLQIGLWWHTPITMYNRYLRKTTENAYQLQNVKDSCRNYGGFISGEQPFLRCKSMFRNRQCVRFKRPYNNLQANQRVLFHGHASFWIWSNTFILSDNIKLSTIWRCIKPTFCTLKMSILESFYFRFTECSWLEDYEIKHLFLMCTGRQCGCCFTLFLSRFAYTSVTTTSF